MVGRYTAPFLLSTLAIHIILYSYNKSIRVSKNTIYDYISIVTVNDITCISLCYDLPTLLFKIISVVTLAVFDEEKRS